MRIWVGRDVVTGSDGSSGKGVRDESCSCFRGWGLGAGGVVCWRIVGVSSQSLWWDDGCDGRAEGSAGGASQSEEGVLQSGAGVSQPGAVGWDIQAVSRCLGRDLEPFSFRGVGSGTRGGGRVGNKGEEGLS